MSFPSRLKEIINNNYLEISETRSSGIGDRNSYSNFCRNQFNSQARIDRYDLVDTMIRETAKPQASTTRWFKPQQRSRGS